MGVESYILESRGMGLHRILILTRREIRDSLRDWRILGPILVLTAIFPWLMSAASQGAAQFAVDYGVADNAAIILQQLVPFSLLIVGFFPISFSLVIALETFVGERERNTLEPLLATPVSDQELYLGKLLAAVALPLSASYLGLLIHLASLTLTTSYRVPLIAILQVLILTTLEAVVMVAGAVVVSSNTTSVRAANLLASFIIIPVALLLQAEAVLLFWRSYDALWWLALGLVFSTIVLVRTGMRLFNREEILAREFDEFSLPRLWQRLRILWAMPPAAQPLPISGQSRPLSLGEIYRHHLPPLLRDNRTSLFVTFLVMLSGLFIGWGLALEHPFPPGLVDLARLNRSDLTGWQGINLLPSQAAWTIFFHNLRALLIMAALGIFTFGTAPLLLTMPTMGLVGFFAGQAGNIGYSSLLFLAAFVLPHGVFELTAAWLAVAFAVKIGLAVMAPIPGRTLGDGVLEATVNFAKVFLLIVIPLLAVAAVIETWITPRIIAILFG